jgi:hypothetical protein
LAAWQPEHPLALRAWHIFITEGKRQSWRYTVCAKLSLISGTLT